MAEWFRGVAEGGPVATPSQVNDLGPGTYFADRLQAAEYYAGHRTDQANRIPTGEPPSVPMTLRGEIAEASLGRVLDLTSGPEAQSWNKFAEERSFSGGTNRDAMALGPEQYGPRFKMWAVQRGIKLESYDAIIGPEYGAGGKVLGKQLCVRNPQVAERVVAQMDGMIPSIPKGAPGLVPSAIPSLTYSVKGQANAAALIAIAMIIDTAQRELNSYFQEQWARDAVNADIRAIREWQRQNPGDGALIVTTFKRTLINSEFMQNKVAIQPGDAFEFNSVFYGATPADAAKVMGRTQEAVQGDTFDGPYRTIRRKQAIWVPPRIPNPEGFTNLPGRWNVTVGDWKGVFGFNINGECYWKQGAEPAHTGTWKVVGSEFQWTYGDDQPGWERVFHAAIPLKKTTSGAATIKGVNHGAYTMVKAD